MDFQLVSDYKPRGDQGRAIAELLSGVSAGEKHQVLLGVTGSGKTFTMAKIIEELDKLRLSATRSLFERRDSIIVSSVSCIYGLGDPDAYYGMLLLLEKGQRIS